MKKSFTLIEMLIVIVIIGILAAALIPRLQSVQERANATKVLKITYDVDVSMKIKELDLGVAPTGIWDFQGDFTDRSGLGNDFTTISELSNAFVRDTAFQKDRVLSGTGGSTERGAIPANTKNFPTDKVCIAGLFNFSSDLAGQIYYVRTIRNTLSTYNNQLGFRVRDNSTSTYYQDLYVATSVLGITPGRRYHVAVEFNGSGSIVWINGVQKYSNSSFTNAPQPYAGSQKWLSLLQHDDTPYTKMSRLRIRPYTCSGEVLK